MPPMASASRRRRRLHPHCGSNRVCRRLHSPKIHRLTRSDVNQAPATVGDRAGVANREADLVVTRRQERGKVAVRVRREHRCLAVTVVHHDLSGWDSSWSHSLTGEDACEQPRPSVRWARTAPSSGLPCHHFTPPRASTANTAVVVTSNPLTGQAYDASRRCVYTGQIVDSKSACLVAPIWNHRSSECRPAARLRALQSGRRPSRGSPRGRESRRPTGRAVPRDGHGHGCPPAPREPSARRR